MGRFWDLLHTILRVVRCCQQALSGAAAAAAPSIVEESEMGARNVDGQGCAKISYAGKTGVNEASKTQCED